MFSVTCTMKTWSRGNVPNLVASLSSMRTPLFCMKSRCRKFDRSPIDWLKDSNWIVAIWRPAGMYMKAEKL